MKAKIAALGRIKKEFPPHGHLQLFQLKKPATFICSVRKVEVTSAKVALDLRTGDLLSNGAYGQLLAGHLYTPCLDPPLADPRCCHSPKAR